MFKKSLSNILLAILCISLLAGCKGNEQTNVQTKNDFGAAGTYPINTDEVLDMWMSLSISLSTQVTNFSETPLAAALKEKTGVTINYIHPASGQESEQFNLLLASGDMPDIISYTFKKIAQKAIDEKSILALNEPIEKWAPNLEKLLKTNDLYRRLVTTEEGNYYVFPYLREDDSQCVYVGPIVRKDWLEDLDLKVPETIADWEIMLHAFKEKKGADIPFSAQISHINNGLFMGAYGINGTMFVDGSGKVQYGPIQDSYKDFLVLMNRWYNEGLIDKNIASVDPNILDNNVLTGRVGASAGYASGSLGKWINAMEKENTDFDLLGVPYPVLNKGETPMFSTMDSRYTPYGSCAITTSCKNIELATRYLDYGYSDEGHMLYNFGIEGKSYNMVNGEPKLTDEFLFQGNTRHLYSMASYSAPSIQDVRLVNQTQSSTPQIADAVNTWAKTEASKHNLPAIYYTQEDNTEYANIMTDLETYRDEMLLSFIMGVEPISNFDQYVQQMKNMGIDRAVEITQKTLNKFNEQ